MRQSSLATALITRVAATTASAILAAACGKHPGPLVPSAVAPSLPASLAINGPMSVAPGTIGQFRALLTTGAQVLDVSDKALWSSGNTALLNPAGPGQFTAGDTLGETDISATYNGQGYQAHVYVLSDGTFVLHGRVFDDAAPAAGAHVQVTWGTGAGSSATSRGDGTYVLFGVGGDITVRTTQDGYDAATRAASVQDNFSMLDFTLSPAGRGGLGGNWQLTVTASDSCSDLPDEARRRAYPVSIVQSDSLLDVWVTLPDSASMSTERILLKGSVSNGGVRIVMPTDVVDGPEIYERLHSGQFFTLSGEASGNAGADGASGVVSGEIHVFTTWPGTTCVATDHRFQLRRAP